MSVWRRIRNAFRSDPAMDHRIDEEMDFHVEMRAAELEARGVEPAEARRRARIAFGNRTAQAESAREAHLAERLAGLVRNLRFAGRSLSRRPVLVVTAVLSLALGIGANVALFSVLDAVALRPLPIPNLPRIHAIRETKGGEATGGNPLRLADFGEQVSSFQAVTGYYGESPLARGTDGPVRVPVLRVFGDYFGVTGEGPIAGRLFTAAERSGEPVAVLRRAAAIRWFGAADSALGRTLELDGAGYTVVGVVGDGAYPADVDAWLPAGRDLQAGPRAASYLFTAALLAPGRTAADAAAELTLVQARLGRTYPDTDAERTARLEPLQQTLIGETRGTLLLVQSVAAALLLIACLNLAGLLLARSLERRRESAIRSALGAGRGGLIRLYFAESALLGGAGSLAGIGVTALCLRLLRSASLPIDLPRLAEAGLDARALGAAAFLGFLATAVFGTAPAFAAARGSLLPALERSASANRGRSALVTLQAGLALLLLLAAGALLGAVRGLEPMPGFRAERIVAARIAFGWGTPDATIHQFSTRALESFAAIPGVRAVGLTDRLPLGGGTQSSPVTVVGRDLPPELDLQSVGVRAVSPGYFTALGIPIISGRNLGEPRTAVVNEPFARRWLGDQPLGRRVTYFGDNTVEVVGVVPGIRQSALVADAEPELFINAGETYWPLLNFVLAAGADQDLGPAIRERVREIAPEQIVDSVEPLTAALSGATRTPRLISRLFGIFAALAIALVGIGLAGLLASYVGQRTRELGIRLAVGARPGRIASQVAWQGLRLVLIGAAAGAAAWIWVRQALARLPVAIDLDDPVLLGGGLMVLLGIGIAVSLIPAWRGARIDPVTALRTD
ncbi:MAG: ABC transporter permease [Gemmatimonadales bacterium]